MKGEADLVSSSRCLTDSRELASKGVVATWLLDDEAELLEGCEVGPSLVTGASKLLLPRPEK